VGHLHCSFFIGNIGGLQSTLTFSTPSSAHLCEMLCLWLGCGMFACRAHEWCPGSSLGELQGVCVGYTLRFLVFLALWNSVWPLKI
jgi:hypothetical protein